MRGKRRAHRRGSPAIVVVCLVLAGLVVLGAVLRSSGPPRAPQAADLRIIAPSQQPSGPPVARRTPAWLTILRELDARRTQAVVEDRPRRLTSVYAPGSTVLGRDQAMLAAYRRRGLRLVGLQLRVLRARQMSASQARLRLWVVDELGPSYALSPAGRRLRLPTDRPSAHVITLHRTHRGWRIAAVS